MSGSVTPMPAPRPPVSAPLVWVELVTADVARAAEFYGAVLGWRTSRASGATDLVVYLDAARTAGPICGIRPRSPGDPLPPESSPPRPDGGRPSDRWGVRLSPPRPPLAADPDGDQLLRPRAPGPRLGRWASPNALCFAELRTPDLDGARGWLERRLDAQLEPAPSPGAAATLLLHSAVEPGRPVAALVDESLAAAHGWYPCVQVASLERTVALALEAGAGEAQPRPVPAGCAGSAAAVLTDPGGARLVLVEHGPVHGRR